jgi:hypothetical protein
LVILEKLVKSHFEVNGTFAYFPYKELLAEVASEKSMFPQEYYLKLLGYGGGKYSPPEHFKARFDYCQGNEAALVPVYGKTEQEAKQNLSKAGLLPKERLPSLPKISISDEGKQTARLLATYFLNSEELELLIGENVELFSDYLTKIVYSVDVNKLSAFVDAASFKKVLQIVTPVIEYKEDSDPLITGGVMYLPFKLEKKASIDKVVKLAVLQAMIKIFDIPEKVFSFVTRNAASYQLLETSKYLTLLDYSYLSKRTVKELFELCGLQYVDNLKYFNETRCVIYLNGKDSYRVYSINSVLPEDYVVMSGTQLKLLYENNSLKTLNWDGPVLGPYVVIDGKRTYLNEISI